MKLKIHKNLREAIEIEATRVLVEDKLGNPIAVALEFAEGAIFAATADNPNFKQILERMGITKVVVVKDVPTATSLDEVRFG